MSDTGALIPATIEAYAIAATDVPDSVDECFGEAVDTSESVIWFEESGADTTLTIDIDLPPLTCSIHGEAFDCTLDNPIVDATRLAEESTAPMAYPCDATRPFEGVFFDASTTNSR